MESKNQRGQVLIEFGIIIFVLTMILFGVLKFHAPRLRTEILKYQIRDMSIYNNEGFR